MRRLLIPGHWPLAPGLLLFICALVAIGAVARPPRQADWKPIEEETLRHFQALVREDTSDPPGNERPAAEYLKKVLEAEGISVQTFALEPNRPNVVARLKGNGSKRPLLIMGHTDVVNVDPKKWTHPPFSATRDAGYVYGRGTVDDKDNVVAALMVMLLLKRQNVPLDRDVIFLAEAGEEGSTRVGIQFMVNQHFPLIDAEYCLAEGGNVTRVAGRVKFASVQTLEKIPRGVELTARGVAGHGSVPLKSNAIVHLAGAVAKLGAWRTPIRLKRRARTSSGWQRSPRPRRRNVIWISSVPTRRARQPPTTTWSITSRVTPRCCARRSHRTFFKPVIAST
jgi:acetylornithine deacetylase/succinyl-diaminopimelate desuccinylase-like protein